MASPVGVHGKLVTGPTAAQPGACQPQEVSCPLPAQSEGISSPELQQGNPLHEAVDTVPSIQPSHPLLTASPIQPSTESSAAAAPEVLAELAALRSSKVPLAVKALIVGAGLATSIAFAASNILPPPNDTFGGMLIGFIAFLMLPIVDAEFTSIRLHREFKLMPLQSTNLPSLKEILEDGCTPKQFGMFVEEDLLPRMTKRDIKHVRSLASDAGTCLHDVTHWTRDRLHFPGTTWKTVYNVIESLGVGEDILLRVKAALLVIERDTTLNEASLPEINTELADLASMLA